MENTITDNKTSTENRTESTRWGLAATLLWGALIALVFVITQGVALIVFLFGRHGMITNEDEILQKLASAQEDGFFLSVATIAACIITVPVILGIIKLKKNSRLAEYLALRKPDIGKTALWIFLLVIFLVISSIISTQMGKEISPEFMKNVYASSKPMWLLIIALVIAAPITEELFFRGFLFEGMRSSVLGLAGTIVFTSAVWAMIHTQYDLYIMIHIFAVGIMLSLARLHTNTLIVPIILHGFNNLLSVVVVAYITQNQT